VQRVETFFVHSQPDPLTDFGIKEKIKATLFTDPRLIAGQVDLGVYAGHVVLVGVVDSWERSRSSVSPFARWMASCRSGRTSRC
jgi:hypothetical protein